MTATRRTETGAVIGTGTDAGIPETAIVTGIGIGIGIDLEIGEGMTATATATAVVIGAVTGMIGREAVTVIGTAGENAGKRGVARDGTTWVVSNQPHSNLLAPALITIPLDTLQLQQRFLARSLE